MDQVFSFLGNFLIIFYLVMVQVVEGDTARALSWMIANMSKIVEDNPSASVVDMIPLERVVDTPAFRLQPRVIIVLK